ncbi:MAG: serine/threonine protein kinase, partial [Phycisphaerales bacterium]|nr:serine/threonine protein kinase [Phycisphaerales bacterium]
MVDDPRIPQLLDEVLDTARTPEEVCATCPELAGEVRARWERCRRMEAQISALFPSSGPIAGGRRAPHRWADLPRIPGYDVQSVLGRGGCGVVFKARHLKLNRVVALKMLLSGAFAGRLEVARFTREAEAVAGLRHPNVVQVHDVGDHEGRPYFTMEFVEGGSLAEKLAGAPQPAAAAAALLFTLAGAVQAAHDGGVVHRDLKPSNVLLTADGTPKISDFGLARRFEDSAALTLTGARVGTPSYMAPEQAAGTAGAVGPPADVYALGAILYEMLTGRPPFRGETALETQRQLVTEEPVRPSRLNPKVPRDLETICLTCLRKDPHRRYATAAALAQDLRRFERREPIAARATGQFERAVKWVRRHPSRAAGLATAAAVAAVAFGGCLWLASERAATAR